MKRLLLLFLFLLLSIPIFAQDNSTVQTILKNGKIRVGMSSFVPWAFRDKEGNFVGFEIDVAKELAKDLGVELELVPTAWDGIIPALLSGKMDVIIGGMSVTTKRNLQVNFTTAYSSSGLQLAASKKAASGFKTMEDFNKRNVTIVVRRGGNALDAAKAHFPKAKVRLFDDEASLEREVINGNAHALISSSPNPAFLEYNNPDTVFRPFKSFLSQSDEGFAVRKGDPDTLNVFNNWITSKFNSGWLPERHSYWFETRDWQKLLPESK